MLPIWEGDGDAEGSIYFVGDRGTVYGRPAVIAAAGAALRRFTMLTRLERARVIARTARRDDWLRAYAGQTPAAVGRAVLAAYEARPELAHLTDVG